MAASLSQRWCALWTRRAADGGPRLSPDEVAAVWKVLDVRYGEPHRAYHTLDHLAECFEELDRLGWPARDREQIELAIWFHDVVYNPRDARPGANEEESVWEMQRQLPAHGWRPGEQTAVGGLILATRHGQTPPIREHQAVPLAHWLVDIDLSVLGRSAERYQRYRRAIRQEFKHVNDAGYRAGRRAVLEKFLGRPRIYLTEAFGERYEPQARVNLQHELDGL